VDFGDEDEGHQAAGDEQSGPDFIIQRTHGRASFPERMVNDFKISNPLKSPKSRGISTKKRTGFEKNRHGIADRYPCFVMT
jgi:hypothetical protein